MEAVVPMSARPFVFLVCVVLFISSLPASQLAAQPHQSLQAERTGTDALNGTIFYPRCSDPTFVTPGGTFTVHLTLTGSDNSTGFDVTIETAYEPIVDHFGLSYTIESANSTDVILNVTIPDTVPIELYNLTVHLSSDGLTTNLTQPRAVDVIASFSDTFTFIHLTDLHVGDWRGITQSVYRSLHHRALLQCIAEVNLQHPDFVVISGDLVFGQLYPHEYSKEYPELYDLLQRFDVPTFLCPGNHDGYSKPGEDGKAFWAYYFGPDYYSFNYGPYHFQMLDSYDFPKAQRTCISFASLNWGGSIQDTQLQWIAQDLNASASAPLTFMVLHHSPLLETTKESLLHTPYKNRDALLQLIQNHSVDMVLAGHVHWDNVTIVNDTIYATTTTPTSSVDQRDSYWGYRVIHIQNGTIDSYNYKDPKYSTPLYKLKTRTLTPTAIFIRNRQQTPLPLFLRFLVPFGNYTANIGSIVQVRQNATAQEVYVQLSIGALHSRLVRLQKTK